MKTADLGNVAHAHLGAIVAKRKTVCLVVIAHNEAHVLPRLFSSVKPLIDYYVIALNGTTDNSVEIIQERMAGVPGEIHERPWQGYAETRNDAIRLACAAKFRADYILMMDADDFLERPDIDVFRTAPGNFGSYNIETRIGAAVVYQRTLFFRTDPTYRFVGAVHEVLVRDAGLDIAPTWLENVICWVIGGGDSSKDPDKYKKHAALLLEEFGAQHPLKDPRTAFYLGQSYRDAGDHASAICWYERRVIDAHDKWRPDVWQAGNGAEVFPAWMTIAQLKFATDLPGAIYAAMKAIETEPARKAEVCCDFVRRFAEQRRFELAVAWGEMGGAPDRIGPPPKTLFVDVSPYQWRLLLEWGAVAWHVGRREEAKRAFERLRSIAPAEQQPIIEANLELCT